MVKLASPVWAVILAGMGTGVALAVLFHHTENSIALAVLTVSSNLVSGALGGFAGHAMGSKSDVTTGNDQVTISQNDPK